MNVKPILARLQSALNNQDLVEQMVLLPESAALPPDQAKSPQLVNLVVGYNGSPNSQTALDIALWIAHQTRLATPKQVTVHVVYVVDENQSYQHPEILDLVDVNQRSMARNQLELPEMCAASSSNSVLTQVRTSASRPLVTALDLFDRADRILWQARCLAEEWKGVFTAHLRFGCLSSELSSVVTTESADLLLLGCHSSNHPIVRRLEANFPCMVLGIPRC